MTPTRLLHLEMQIFLMVLIALIAYRLLTGAIHVKGLLSQSDGTGQVSPGRIQLLLSTLAAAATYLSRVASTTDGRMPDIDHRLLYVTAVSSGIYALDKVFARWRSVNNLKSPNTAVGPPEI